MAKRKKDTNKDSSTEDIMSIGRTLASELNNSYKNSGNKAYFLAEGDDVSSNITDYVSTGCTPLDYIISNKRNGGIPVGRITEIYGLESSGKSLLAAHIAKSTQQKGGQVVYIDTENAISSDFFRAIGVDIGSLILIPMWALEDIFKTVEDVIHIFRQKTKDIPLTIIVDSIMGSSTRKEQESDYNKDGYNTEKSQIMSKAMRKLPNYVGANKVTLVFINQMRVNLAALGPEKYTTSGGKALPFAASIRIRLKQGTPIYKSDKKTLLGYSSKAVIDKNKIAPPKRSAVYKLYFSKGIDDYESILDQLILDGIITTSKAWNYYSHFDKDTGEEKEVIKFYRRDFYEKVFSNPIYNEDLLNQLEHSMLIPYDKVAEGDDNGTDDYVFDFDPDNDNDDDITEDIIVEDD